MEKKFVIISHVPTQAVDEGFIPKVLKKKLSIIILTDKDTCYTHLVQKYAEKVKIIHCDVYNPTSIINTLNGYQISPIAIFSNSDHLQASTSIAAEFYQLPTKSWQASQISKNKSLMRQILLENNLSNIWQYTVSNYKMLNAILEKLTYPLIAKPCLGVASIGVKKIESELALMTYLESYWQNNKNNTNSQSFILLEKYIAGTIYSMETIGARNDIHILGGFKTRLSQPPYFIETGAQWINNFPQEINEQVLHKLRLIGVNFGSCHTEFVINKETNKVDIIEINYRSAGDQKEFIINNIYADHYFDTIIDLYLGEKDIKLKPKFMAAEIEYLLPTEVGVLTKTPQANFKSDNLIISSFTPLKGSGDEIKITNSNKDYIGILYSIGQTKKTAEAILNKEKSKLELEFNYV
ncbi:MAG: biotin carboxylase [Francisellaceae bacterium]|jgi:biotin carboxylase